MLKHLQLGNKNEYDYCFLILFGHCKYILSDATAFRMLSLRKGDVVSVAVISVMDNDLVICQPTSSQKELMDMNERLQQQYSDYGT